MPYRKTPAGHTEFGGGPGLIDPEVRKDRAVSNDEMLMELYASNPEDPATPIQDTDLYAVPRPAPYEYPDKARRKGTVEP